MRAWNRNRPCFFLSLGVAIPSYPLSSLSSLCVEGSSVVYITGCGTVCAGRGGQINDKKFCLFFLKCMNERNKVTGEGEKGEERRKD